jgi:hypothetical protein
MPEDVYVDLQYQGIELGTQLCMQEFTKAEAYVQCPQPMPVGSPVVLCIGEDLKIPVQVARVSEQVAGAERPAGMFVGATGLDGAAQAWWLGNIRESEAQEPAVVAEKVVASPEDSEGPDTEVMDVVTPEEIAAKATSEATPPPEETKSAPKGKKKRRRKRQTRNK